MVCTKRCGNCANGADKIAMDRRRLVWVAVGISALALLYGVSFGPALYLVVKAEKKSLFSEWMETPLTVMFYPHLWACYRYEPYFTYIAWFVVDSRGGSAFTWQDFREKHVDKFGK
jgi:hypothetical protein